MITKTIKYHDFEGNEREDQFTFSLNQVQYAKINGMFPGGIEEYIKRASKSGDASTLLKLIDLIVSEAYGERVGDGFVKKSSDGQKYADYFINTEAYDNLLTELIEDPDNLLAFMVGCLPKNAQDKVNAELKKREAEIKAATDKYKKAKDNTVEAISGETISVK